MANDDFHPADDLAKAFQGLFDGTNIKEAIRGAWDRHFGAAAQSSDQSDTVKAMNKASMDKAANDAAASFRNQPLSPNAATAIRAKVAGK